MWHCEVRDGLLVMKMSSMLFCLVGVVIICSVWVVRSMSKKRLLMSTGYECPCMVQSVLVVFFFSILPVIPISHSQAFNSALVLKSVHVY